VVAEQLGEAKHKQPMCTHIVVVPRLMMGRWRRELIKEADFWTQIPAGTSFWPKEMHESLTLFVALPLIRCQPWALKGNPALESLDRQLRGLWFDSEERCGHLLRKFLFKTREFQSMLERPFCDQGSGGSRWL
jgi:hypothetical protein